ncbi:MAG TPA: TetR family transcriptional regulator [Allosphingosinicella sp.]|nr:TetR family transcriptional regulator [Allosphingosinicella sp.]
MFPPIQARLRNAAATRQAILDSARRHFAREGYDNVGLREIAGDAGVDPALVSRYFGGKERLLKEAVRSDTPPLFEGIRPADLPAHLAGLLLEDEGDGCGNAAEKTERLLILLRSASSPRASEIVREAAGEDILRPIAALLDGAGAEARASLCLAILVGVGMLRSAFGLLPARRTEQAALRAALERLFEAALGDAGRD